MVDPVSMDDHAAGRPRRDRPGRVSLVPLRDQQPYLGRLDAWHRWRDVVVARYEEQGDQGPLGSLFLQVGRATPAHGPVW